MGKCYYYGNRQNEIQVFEKTDKDDIVASDSETKRIIIDENTELVIEKDTIYEIDRKCEKCLKNRRK